MSPSENTNRNGEGVERDLMEQLRVFLSAISLSEDTLMAFFMTLFPDATNKEEICGALNALVTKTHEQNKCKHLERVMSYLPKTESEEGYHSGEFTDSTISVIDNTQPPPARKRRIDESAKAPPTPHLVLNDQYLFLKAVEGTTYYSCIDLRRKVRLICRPSENPCDDLIQRSDLMKHHHRINHIVEIVRRPTKTYIFYAQPGEDLLSYVRQKQKLSEDESRKLFVQIVGIVQDCHAQGIILRDLKMRKFFFTDDEKTSIKLESLEDAVTLENKDVDALEQRRGCPVYIAPEILKVNETYQGKPSDVWSLGVILYTLVAGRYPFNEIEHEQLFAKIAAADYALPTNITRTLGTLLSSMLAKDPKDRIKSTDILSHSWFRTDKDFVPENDDQCVPDTAAEPLPAGSPTESF